MIAKMTVEIGFVFMLIAAIVFFLLACPHKYFQPYKGWFLPLGLICFAGAFVVKAL